MRPKAQRAGQGTAYAKTGGGSPPLQLDAAELSQDLASRHEPLRKVMPMTVLRHRGRPRGKAPEAFDLQRNGWKPGLPARRQRSNRMALPTTNYPTTPTRNRNVPKYPLREKPQIQKAGEPLQLDREDLRLVDQVQLKLQRGDLVRGYCPDSCANSSRRLPAVGMVTRPAATRPDTASIPTRCRPRT